MSLATWKPKHYPIPASKCTEDGALEHTLQKYLGTRKTALKRHRLVAINGTLTDGVYKFGFGHKTCALCTFYRADRHCHSACPLLRETGMLCGRHGSAYDRWCETGDPEPMIRALRRAIKKQKAEVVSA